MVVVVVLVVVVVVVVVLVVVMVVVLVDVVVVVVVFGVVVLSRVSYISVFFARTTEFALTQKTEGKKCDVIPSRTQSP